MKIPKAVDVMKIKIAISLPSIVGSEKIKIIIIKMVRIIDDSLL